MQAHAESIRLKGQTIAFVPTMGFLHEGHLTLLREGKTRGDHLVLSIFVNPTQFGPSEDFDAYPRNMERDFALAEGVGVDTVFTPDTKSFYENNFQTWVELTALPRHLCGLSRDVHFKGVATVVTKLFNTVKPHIALFGAKDYQQLAVIRQMVRDLNFDISIIGVPTVREADGLAMSSRNAYLSEDQRKQALCLSETLALAKKMIGNGETSASAVLDAARALIQARPAARIDYIAICDPDTLDDIDTIQKPVLMAMAVYIGDTRLIDNAVVSP